MKEVYNLVSGIQNIGIDLWITVLKQLVLNILFNIIRNGKANSVYDTKNNLPGGASEVMINMGEV